MKTDKTMWGLGVRDLGSDTYRIRVEPVQDLSTPFQMRGTEGTGRYVVIVASLASKDAIAKLLTRDADWKQPGDGSQDRFSKVVSGDAMLKEYLAVAAKAIGADKDKAVYNSGKQPVPTVPEPLQKIATVVGVKYAPRTAKATITTRVRRMAASVKMRKRNKTAVASS